MSNSKNIDTIKEFHRFTKSNNAGEKHINNNLKIIMSFANTLGQNEYLEDVLHVGDFSILMQINTRAN